MTLISFVIPCYRSERTIAAVIEEIKAVLGRREGYNYEIVCVNDCSPDGVYGVLRDLATQNKRIKVINLSKNSGKHAALLAGFHYARGEYIVCADDDGQDNMPGLWDLIEALEHDRCDIASAAYTTKKESLLKRIGHVLYIRVTERLLGFERHKRVESFFAVKSFVCKEAARYDKPYPYVEGLLLRVTDRVLTVPMEHRGRIDENSTGYTLRKSIRLFLAGVTTFSVRPLRAANILGASFAMLGFIYGLYIIARKLLRPEMMMGYSSIMAVLLFTGGIIMLLLGVIGEYLGRIYMCINDTPQYIVRDSINIETNNHAAGDEHQG